MIIMLRYHVYIPSNEDLYHITTAARTSLVKNFAYRPDDKVIRPDDIVICPDDILISPDELVFRPDELVHRPDDLNN